MTSMIESKDSEDRKQWTLQSLSDLNIDKLSAPAILHTTSHWDRRRQPRYRLAGGLQVRVSIPPLERASNRLLIRRNPRCGHQTGISNGIQGSAVAAEPG